MANASGQTVLRQSARLSYVVMAAAAATVSGVIILVSVQSYPAAIMLVLAWCIVAATVAVRSMDESLRSRVAAATLIVWFTTAPFAWFFIRFPVQKSIVTYERLVFGLVGLLALFGARRLAPRQLNSKDEAQAGWRALDNTEGEAPTSERRTRQKHALSWAGYGFEKAWLLLTVLACFSAVVASNNTGFALRTAVDAFGLPLVAYYGARTYLKSPQHRRYIVAAAMLLGVFLFAAGAFELATGINLLPYEGSEIVREGELRVNGPFIADTSFAIVSLLLALFLRSAPRMFDVAFDWSARLLYRAGTAAAIVACLLPLFRAVAIALAVCWVTNGILTALPKREDDSDPLPTGGTSSRSAPIPPRLLKSPLRPILTVIIASICLVAGLIVLAPRSIKDRLLSPRNAYGRVLSWRLASNIIYNHPIFGVGLSNYVDYFDKEYAGGRSPVELELDTHIVRQPHSNIVWIATELGLVGLALYLAANVFLLLPAWRAIRRGPGARARAAGACIIVLLAAYWIPGLELTSGMYSELNLYFFFLIGMSFPLLSSEADADRQTSGLRLRLSWSTSSAGHATPPSGPVHGR